MEVIAISEAWIDGVRVSHCGVILFIEGFHDDVKSWSICLPKYDGTFKLKFDPEDVQRTFYYPEKEMAGFLLQSSSDTEIQSLIFSMSIDEVSNSFDEFNVFKKTMSLILANKSYRSYTFHTDKVSHIWILPVSQRGRCLERCVCHQHQKCGSCERKGRRRLELL